MCFMACIINRLIIVNRPYVLCTHIPLINQAMKCVMMSQISLCGKFHSIVVTRRLNANITYTPITFRCIIFKVLRDFFPWAKWNLFGMEWKKKLIINCFIHGGFLQPEEKAYAVVEGLEKIISAPPDMTAQDFEAWMDIDENLETSAALTDYDICEVVSNMNKISVSVSDEDECPKMLLRKRRPQQVLRWGMSFEFCNWEPKEKLTLMGFIKIMNTNALLMTYSVSRTGNQQLMISLFLDMYVLFFVYQFHFLISCMQFHYVK